MIIAIATLTAGPAHSPIPRYLVIYSVIKLW